MEVDDPERELSGQNKYGTSIVCLVHFKTEEKVLYLSYIRTEVQKKNGQGEVYFVFQICKTKKSHFVLHLKPAEAVQRKLEMCLLVTTVKD